MRLTVASIGKTKVVELASLEAEFVRRIQGKLQLDLQYYKTEDKLLAAIQAQSAHYILLDERGVQSTSLEFASWLQLNMDKDMVFIVGDSDGVSDSIRQYVHNTLALSQMTFPHEFARVLLLEQIYRATTIWSGHPYHK